MNKPHKHANMIKAWADGATIEYFDVFNHNNQNDHWAEILNPNWHKDTQYRIKQIPKTIKFRAFLQEGILLRDGISRTPNRICIIREHQQRTNLERFIQWLGEWQEYTIKETNQCHCNTNKETCKCA